MRSPRERERAGTRWYAASAAAFAVATLLTAFSCATQESHDFSDDSCVGDGCQAISPMTSSSGSGSSSASSGCPDVDAGPSFTTDIYNAMLDVGGTAQCTQAGLCHGTASGVGGLVLPPMDPTAAYTALTASTLMTVAPGAKQYIVPGDPGNSGMTCNMAVSSGGTNPWGQCGNPMPNGGTGMDLSVDQINLIATWISCGAQNN